MAGKKTILVIDDEQAICDTMSDMLDEKGYGVLVATNGVDGLKIVAEQPVDLIILDLNMPRMDGYMFMEHLQERWTKESRREPIPPIIVLSAVDMKKDFGLAKNLGATRYMQKPFKSWEFYAAVQESLGDTDTP